MIITKLRIFVTSYTKVVNSVYDIYDDDDKSERG